MTMLPRTRRDIDSLEFPARFGAVGAVLIEGPKGCGKTWAALKQARSVAGSVLTGRLDPCGPSIHSRSTRQSLKLHCDRLPAMLWHDCQ